MITNGMSSCVIFGATGASGGSEQTDLGEISIGASMSAVGTGAFMSAAAAGASRAAGRAAAGISMII